MLFLDVLKEMTRTKTCTQRKTQTYLLYVRGAVVNVRDTHLKKQIIPRLSVNLAPTSSTTSKHRHPYPHPHHLTWTNFPSTCPASHPPTLPVTWHIGREATLLPNGGWLNIDQGSCLDDKKEIHRREIPIELILLGTLPPLTLWRGGGT